MRNARDLTERKRGRHVVAAPPIQPAMILSGAIADYKSNVSRYQRSTVDVQTDRIMNKVRSGEADCRVDTSAEDESGIERKLLGKHVAWRDLMTTAVMLVAAGFGHGKFCPIAAQAFPTLAAAGRRPGGNSYATSMNT
jgi:hypothetical protein